MRVRAHGCATQRPSAWLAGEELVLLALGSSTLCGIRMASQIARSTSAALSAQSVELSRSDVAGGNTWQWWPNARARLRGRGERRVAGEEAGDR